MQTSIDGGDESRRQPIYWLSRVDDESSKLKLGRNQYDYALSEDGEGKRRAEEDPGAVCYGPLEGTGNGFSPDRIGRCLMAFRI